MERAIAVLHKVQSLFKDAIGTLLIYIRWDIVAQQNNRVWMIPEAKKATLGMPNMKLVALLLVNNCFLHVPHHADQSVLMQAGHIKDYQYDQQFINEDVQINE